MCGVRGQCDVSGATMAPEQNASGLRGGNEGQACVLDRPVSAPSLHADMGRLASALPARPRPIDAREARDSLRSPGLPTARSIFASGSGQIRRPRQRSDADRRERRPSVRPKPPRKDHVLEGWHGHCLYGCHWTSGVERTRVERRLTRRGCPTRPGSGGRNRSLRTLQQTGPYLRCALRIGSASCWPNQR